MIDLKDWFRQDVNLAMELYKDTELHGTIEKAGRMMLHAAAAGGKIMIFGNGGSAADAQHFAAELVCKFEKDRRALPAIALTTDTSILTAWSNDQGFESVFERQVEALCRPGDIVFGITTSDTKFHHSRNIFNAFGAAQKRGATRIGLFSKNTINLLNFVDVAIQVPGDRTAIIQQAHRSVIHLLCKLMEEDL